MELSGETFQVCSRIRKELSVDNPPEEDENNCKRMPLKQSK